MRAFASPLPAALLLALCFGPPSGVSAQTLTVTPISVSIGPRDITTADSAYVSGAECTGTMTFRANRAAKLDIWRGAVDSNCDESAQRTLTSMPCTPIHFVDSMTADFVFTLSIEDMMQGKSVCTLSDASSTGQSFEFVFLESASEGNTGTVTSFDTITVRVDAARPVAATISDDKTSLVGESVRVEWELASGESDMLTYRVYTDTAGTCDDGATPTSATLMAGALPPAGVAFTTASGTTATVSPESTGTAIGTSVVVAVAAVDLAGNVGKLSPLVCVSFVETEGFCDDNEDCSKNCAVRMPGSARDEGVPFALLALASLGVVVHARRRRSAK